MIELIFGTLILLWILNWDTNQTTMNLETAFEIIRSQVVYEYNELVADDPDYATECDEQDYVADMLESLAEVYSEQDNELGEASRFYLNN